MTARAVLIRILAAFLGAFVPALPAPAQSLLGAGTDAHGWLALEYPGQGASLLHLPPDAPAGTVVPADPLLPSMPVAIAARDREVVLIYDPAPPKSPAPATTPARVRLVRRVTASELGRPGMYVYSQPSALAPLPSAGRITGLSLTRTGPAVLIEGTMEAERRLLVLSGTGWAPVELPGAVETAAQLRLLQRDESIAILEEPTTPGTPARLWTRPLDRPDAEWSAQDVGVRAGAVAAWFVRAQLMAAYPGDTGDRHLELVRAEKSYPCASTGPRPAASVIVPVGGNVAVVSAEFSPVLRLSSFVVSTSGEVLHDGPAPTAAPISRREVESLLVLLGSLLLTVMVFVFRPAGSLSESVNFPDGFAFASQVRRLGATLIDLAPALAASSWWFGLSPLKVLNLAAIFQLDTGVWPLVLVLALAAAHSAVSEALTSRTIGKALTGCRTIATAGGRPTFAQGIARNLVKYACPPLSMLTLIGPPAPGPHAFGTLVVRAIPPDAADPGGPAA